MLTLSAGTSTARIFPDDGGRLGQLDFGDGPILRGRHPTLPWDAWGAYPLLPWSNRIPGGRVVFGDIDEQLPVNWRDGSAIHGLTADVPWRVDGAETDSASLSVEAAQPPYDVRGEQRFTLADGALDLEVAVVNYASRAVPVGLGIHPWFRAGVVRVPAAARWPGEPVPTAPPIPVAGDDDLRDGRVPALMDRCYTRLTATTAVAPGAELSWDGAVSQVVVYTGEPGWVVVEPVTMANDGFGLAERGVAGHGVQVLEPGARFAVKYRFARYRR
jgi:aldose 1-epimerase